MTLLLEDNDLPNMAQIKYYDLPSKYYDQPYGTKIIYQIFLLANVVPATAKEKCDTVLATKGLPQRRSALFQYKNEWANA